MRAIKAIVMVSLLLVVVSPVLADGETEPSQSFRITIQSFSGDVGSEIQVNGRGAKADYAVFISLATQPHTADGALVTKEIGPNPDGTFSTSLMIPTDAVNGRYYIRGEQFNQNGNTSQYYFNEFIVGTATDDALLPVTGTVPGTPFTITTTLALILLTILIRRGLSATKAHYND